ncbi:hypothetical protein FVE85_9061 [Porphyridium purpureum]|uniref:Uncharacterized protein n=1 Tax=Porphyridium purpureum TaxID=35688 RepID=A0A5J4YMW8_PORPP|nr:hypothetical protein FVE85_9061 [Porphyridium purpureum]|eukprot:POR7851..scf222_8
MKFGARRTARFAERTLASAAMVMPPAPWVLAGLIISAFVIVLMSASSRRRKARWLARARRLLGFSSRSSLAAPPPTPRRAALRKQDSRSVRQQGRLDVESSAQVVSGSDASSSIGETQDEDEDDFSPDDVVKTLKDIERVLQADYAGKSYDDIVAQFRASVAQGDGGSDENWYQKLEPMQQAILQSKAIEEARDLVQQQSTVEFLAAGDQAAAKQFPGRRDGRRSAKRKRSADYADDIRFEFRLPRSYLLFAERLNGKLALTGLLIGLAREWLEPAHPSFIDQVLLFKSVPVYATAFLHAVQNEIAAQQLPMP